MHLARPPATHVKAFDEPDHPYLPDEVLFRQKEQFSDGVGYDWVDGLKEYAAQVDKGCHHDLASGGSCHTCCLYTQQVHPLAHTGPRPTS